jgi:peptidoglycan/LPS O-acetylase OafA/YrhL
MLLRIGRLYPTHHLMLAIYVLTEILFSSYASSIGGRPPFTGAASLTSLVSNLFLVQSLGLHGQVTWNAPSWSISTEFYTYLVFAAGVIFFRERIKTAALLTLLFSSVLLYWLPKGSMGSTYDYGFWRCLFGFGSGVVAFQFWEKYHPALKQLLSPGRSASLVELGIVLAVILFVSLARGAKEFLAPLVFASAVLIFSLEAGGVSRTLTKRPFALVGGLSYSIYMVHYFIARKAFKAGFQFLELRYGLTLTQPKIDGGTFIGTNLWLGDLLNVLYLVVVLVASYIIFTPGKTRPAAGSGIWPSGSRASRVGS